MSKLPENEDVDDFLVRLISWVNLNMKDEFRRIEMLYQPLTEREKKMFMHGHAKALLNVAVGMKEHAASVKIKALFPEQRLAEGKKSPLRH